MQKRLRNLPAARQGELRRQYPWLRTVASQEGSLPAQLKSVAISVFDHWLSRDEANQLLENVPREVQAGRDARHAEFCALVVAKTPVLSFAFRGRRNDRTVFREFISAEALARYCMPHGGPTLRHHKFRVFLPELGCAFFEGWDDTHHFYSKNAVSLSAIQGWAKQCGLYVLEHG